MTISAFDVTPSEDLIQLNQEKMDNAYEKCEEQIKLFNQGTIELKAGCNKEQTLESNINGILSKIRDEVGELCR